MIDPIAVLTLSGHDPTGGAGIQADIETIIRFGCHPCSVITALTAQDSNNIVNVYPQNTDDFQKQLDILAADIPVRAIKIGLLGSPGIGRAIASFLLKTPSTPVILDPILRAGGGKSLADPDLIGVITQQLLPWVTVLTPNTQEARWLTGENDPDRCAQRLLELGCRSVLITGGHAPTPNIENRYYSGQSMMTFTQPRLPQGAHGSGCTLAAAIAANLALQKSLQKAVEIAQEYTWQTVKHAYRLGGGQRFPNRREMR